MSLLAYVELVGVLIAVVAGVTAVVFVLVDQRTLGRHIRRQQQQIVQKVGQNVLLQEDIRRLEAEALRLQELLQSSHEVLGRTTSERDHLQTATRQLETEGVRLSQCLEEAEEKGQLAEGERRTVSEHVSRLEVALRQARGDLQIALEGQRLAKSEVDLLKAAVRDLQRDERSEAHQENSLPEQTAARETDEGEQNSREAIGKGRTLDPFKRGGRSRGSGTSPQEGAGRNLGSFPRKPEIVCWRRERQWIPGVEVPEELFERAGVEVFQDGLPLNRDDSNERCWQLGHARGTVEVRWAEDGVPGVVAIEVGDEEYLLFKLTGEEQNEGFRVRIASSGSYLVMVPIGWNRDEALSDTPIVAPELVSIEGYQAHFFLLHKNDAARIAFQISDGEEITIPSGASRFDLIGARLTDASDVMGPLFSQEPPLLRDLEAPAWQRIRTIVIGEEGQGRNRWRTEFSPVAGKMDQELPSSVANRRGGWYFIRIYDEGGDRIESLDFRFSSALKEIRIEGHAVLPGHSGHDPVRVTFERDSTSIVALTKEGDAGPSIQHEYGRTEAIIPAKPAWDLTEWKIEPAEGAQVEFAVLVERIWWSLGEEGLPLTQIEMSDKPLPVARDAFRATSTKAIHLYLPTAGWTQRVLVGFNQSRSRVYRAKVNERIVSIPLRDFGDADPFSSREGHAVLRVWLEGAGGDEGGAAIVEVLPETATLSEAPMEVATPLRSLVDPSQLRCCSTCDHARRGKTTDWCRRQHWGPVARDEFDVRFTRFLCGEWRGEYRGVDDRWYME